MSKSHHVTTNVLLFCSDWGVAFEWPLKWYNWELSQLEHLQVGHRPPSAYANGQKSCCDSSQFYPCLPKCEVGKTSSALSDLGWGRCRCFTRVRGWGRIKSCKTCTASTLLKTIATRLALCAVAGRTCSTAHIVHYFGFNRLGNLCVHLGCQYHLND